MILRVVLITLGGASIVALAIWATLRMDDQAASVFVDLYQKSLRAALFSAFLSLGGFLFALKTFIVVKMKELVYDQPSFIDRLLDMRKLDSSVSHYGPLKALSTLLFAAILSCFLTAVLQFTAGLIDSRNAVAVCIGSALLSIYLLSVSLLNTWFNLRAMFRHIEEDSKRKHQPPRS